MTMNIDDPARLNGTIVIGGDGEKLGSVDAVYYDNATDRAEWVAVRSGLFGTRVALVPLRRADYSGDALRVPFDKVQLRNAPHHDPGRELSASDEADLYRYYGIDYGQSADESARRDVLAGGVRLAKETVIERPMVEGDVPPEHLEPDGPDAGRGPDLVDTETIERDRRDERDERDRRYL